MDYIGRKFGTKNKPANVGTYFNNSFDHRLDRSNRLQGFTKDKNYQENFENLKILKKNPNRFDPLTKFFKMVIPTSTL